MEGDFFSENEIKTVAILFLQNKLLAATTNKTIE
jgi:hypothetical protein